MGSTDLVLKSARIVDICGKSSGFADLKNTVIMDQLGILVRIPDCACLDVRNLGLQPWSVC